MTPIINYSKIKFLLSLIFLYYTSSLIISYFTAVNTSIYLLPNLYDLGRISGVLGFSSIVLQMLLSSRLSFLERGVSLDRLSRWHKTNARLTYTFILLHPFLLFFEFIKRSNFSFIKNLTLYEWFGAAALILLTAFVAITILSGTLKIKYETWELTHKTAYVVIILAAVHSFFVRGGISYKKPLFYWWVFLAALAVTTFILKYTTKKRREFKITEILSETPNVRTIKLEPSDGKPIFEYKPGQFSFITFLSGSLPKEQHPFTISSSPNGKYYSHTIKESGDFTKQLGKLQTGDSAVIEGPYGVFSNYGMKGPFVFVAGGVGITPLMSMIRYNAMQSEKERIILFYCVRSQKDIVFKDELVNLQQNGYWLRIVYIFSDEKTEINYYGTINNEILAKELDYFELYKFFICGPPKMMSKAVKDLLKLGAHKNKIFTEEFKLK